MKLKWINFIGVTVITFFGIPSYVYAMGPAPQGGSGGGPGLIGYLVPLLLILIVLFIIFLALRELFCWYWKINETISLLKEIRDLLQKSISRAKPGSPGSTETT